MSQEKRNWKIEIYRDEDKDLYFIRDGKGKLKTTPVTQTHYFTHEDLLFICEAEDKAHQLKVAEEEIENLEEEQRMSEEQLEADMKVIDKLGRALTRACRDLAEFNNEPAEPRRVQEMVRKYITEIEQNEQDSVAYPNLA